jgi:peptidoglycan-associated lipoprotein
MTIRRLLLLAVLLAVPLAACSRRQPPPQQPGPRAVPFDTAGQGARREAFERARQDSIARARAGEDATRREAGARARAILEERVHFDYDESRVRVDAQEALSRKVPILRANPIVRLRIEGHADQRGSVEYNLALGMRRANAVRDYLAGFGIDATRFEIVSMGEDMPLDARSTEAAWALNRRAEFTITAGGETLVMPGS